MKQKIVPTSPKFSLHHTGDNEVLSKSVHPARRRFFFLLSVLAVGTLVGFFGAVIASTIPPEWPLVGQLNIVSLFEQERERVLLPLTGVAQQPMTADTLRLFDETVMLYDEAPRINGAGTFLGNAAILSSDGWLVATSAPFTLHDNNGKEQQRLPVIMTSDGRILTATQTVKDDYTGLIFFHANITDMDPVSFPETATLAVGRSTFVLEEQLGTFFITERSVAGTKEHADRIQSTNVLRDKKILDHDDDLTVSAPVFSHDGNFLGMLNSEGSVVSADIIHGHLADLLADGVLQPLPAQFEYINLSRVSVEEKQQRNVPEHGILIISVQTNDRLGVSFLQSDDVIVSINHRPVEADTDFGSVVHSASGDAPLLFDIVRNGVQQAIEFAL